jgi:hypothetical protein
MHVTQIKTVIKEKLVFPRNMMINDTTTTAAAAASTTTTTTVQMFNYPCAQA